MLLIKEDYSSKLYAFLTHSKSLDKIIDVIVLFKRRVNRKYNLQIIKIY